MGLAVIKAAETTYQWQYRIVIVKEYIGGFLP